LTRSSRALDRIDGCDALILPRYEFVASKHMTRHTEVQMPFLQRRDPPLSCIIGHKCACPRRYSNCLKGSSVALTGGFLMKAVRRLLVLPLVFITAGTGSALAAQQPHIFSSNQVSDAIAARVASQDADRAAVREALARPEVKGVAAGMGIDADRLNAVVDTMSGADLEQAVSTTRQVNQQLVGGDSSITLSTTTIIIALLLLILIIVAVH
jgi:hypothetical protein